MNNQFQIKEKLLSHYFLLNNIFFNLTPKFYFILIFEIFFYNIFLNLNNFFIKKVIKYL
jgi:hypothetical protein